jgi:hypothetical protein
VRSSHFGFVGVGRVFFLALTVAAASTTGAFDEGGTDETH